MKLRKYCISSVIVLLYQLIAVKGSMSLANVKGREGRKYQNILMKSWNIMVKNTTFLSLMLVISGP